MLKARRIGQATLPTPDLDSALTSCSDLAGLLLHVWEKASRAHGQHGQASEHRFAAGGVANYSGCKMRPATSSSSPDLAGLLHVLSRRTNPFFSVPRSTALVFSVPASYGHRAKSPSRQFRLGPNEI